MKKEKITAEEFGAMLFVLFEDRKEIIDTYDYFISPDPDDAFIEQETVYLIIFSIELGIQLSLEGSGYEEDVRNAFFDQIIDYFSETAYPEEATDEMFSRLDHYLDIFNSTNHVDDIPNAMRLSFADFCGDPDNAELQDFEGLIFFKYIDAIMDLMKHYKIKN